MGDRPIRDRTLILRVLVPGLETRLRDKMEERAAAKKEADSGKTGGGPGSHPHSSSSSGARDSNSNKGEQLLELEGVTCEPTALQGNTLWNFHCDGAKYPARLVNLPCPVELHKTHDHVMYYKCTDVAQMLIVYEDSTALAEAEDETLKVEGFPSYYHSGLTPALKRVVERRFAAREHSPIAPPRQEVSDVEEQLVDLMERISKENGATNKRTKVPSLTSAQLANKVLEEVSEEVVEYEPWMDDFGRQPHGVEFDADDPLCSHHPEVWLDPDDIRGIRMQEIADAEQKKKKKEEKAASTKKKKNKKERQKKEKEQQKAEAAAMAAAIPHQKKGIPAKKHTEPEEVDDEVGMMAKSLLNAGEDNLDFEEDDGILDFDFDNEDPLMSDMQLS